MKNRFFKVCIFGWRFVIANCPVRIKKNRNLVRQDKRRRIKVEQFEAAGHRCEMCGAEIAYDEAQMHHILPVCIAPELAAEPSNMMCLCDECHRWLHANPFAYAAQIESRFPDSVDRYFSPNILYHGKKN